jgi:thiamine pyrophosphokinase
MAAADPEPKDFLVAVGGDAGLAPRWRPEDLATATVIVAADSGVDLALAAGLPVDHVVGDLDSASERAVAEAEAAGATVHRHPADKDATDIELAIGLVHELAADRLASGEVPSLHVVGPGGGRLDHTLGDLLLLAGPALAAFDVTASFGPARVAVVRAGRPCQLTGSAGDQVSLHPTHGPARGVETTGLRWALVDADLEPGTTRAMSNELAGANATVSLREGVLLVVQPGTVAPPIAERTTPYDPTPRIERNVE